MIADIIILIINLLITIVTTVITWIVNILPTSPFTDVDLSVPSQYLGYVNYFIPVGRILPVFMLWVGAIVAYKFITWLMHALHLQ